MARYIVRYSVEILSLSVLPSSQYKINRSVFLCSPGRLLIKLFDSLFNYYGPNRRGSVFLSKIAVCGRENITKRFRGNIFLGIISFDTQ